MLLMGKTAEIDFMNEGYGKRMCWRDVIATDAQRVALSDAQIDTLFN